MSRVFRNILILCSFLFVGSLASAQVNDAGLWVSLDVEKQFSQAFSVQYGHSSRFNENITELGSFINELGVNYKLDKKQQVSFTYRFAEKKQLNNMYKPQQRFSLDYRYKVKFSDFQLLMRLRGQYQEYYMFVPDSEDDYKTSIRPKFTVKYPLNRFTLSASGEGFIPVFLNEYCPIDKLRLALGIEYEFNRHHSVQLKYLVQREFYTKNAVTDFVVGVGYGFNF